MTEPPENPDPLTAGAHGEWSQQLYEARGALAEAVSTLRDELVALRQEHDANLAENRELRKVVEEQRRAIGGLEEALASVQGMKIVRWTVPLRRLVYRLRNER